MLREPCVHDRYDKHATGEEFVRSLAVCPGGRPLTDPEALTRLLYQDCDDERCLRGGIGATFTTVAGVEIDGSYRKIPCPSCGGSGRTLKDGVAERINHNGEPTLVVPVSMLKGGNPE